MHRGEVKDTEPNKGDHAGNATGDGKRNDKKKGRKYNQQQYGNRRQNYNNAPYYGKNRRPGGGGDRKNFNNKRPRFEVGERLKEVDLGITEYVNVNVDGFTGTIKERFADFVVHEISVNGQIAQLTNQEIPPNPEDDIDIEELKEKVPADIWEKLQSINANADIEIDVTDVVKEQRRYIHQIVKKLTTVTSETKEVGSKRLMVFSKKYAGRFGGRQDNRKDWSNRGGDYCHFILHKINMDTMDALNQISRVLRLKTGIFSYAGTKDRRARTTQWISVKKMDPKSIMNAARPVRGAHVGNFKFEKEPLKLGKLYGNRFTIALRNVNAPDEIIEKAMASLRDNGFINYYGLQRFGTIASIPTYEIGKALLQGNWDKAIELILKPREGEQDLELAEARKIYQNTKDSRLAYQKIRRYDRLEAKLLWGLNICGQKNLQGALDLVPRNTMLMYVHAYQSFVWNTIVSKRVKDFGLKPIVGDLVYENPDLKDDHETTTFDLPHENEDKNDSEVNSKVFGVHLDKADTDNKVDDQSEKINEINNSTDKKEGDKKPDESEGKEGKIESKDEEDKRSETSERESKERPLPKVKILTADDLPKYTMADIVMPQPGWRVTYPTYAKQWFEETLQKDGLTPELSQKNKKYTLSGSYRKILQIPQDISYKILHYAKTTDDLIPSDIDIMRDIDPPKDNPEGAFKALIIQMSLQSSVYATMALREVLKCDTSSQTHAAQSAAFHEAHEKTEESEKNEHEEESSRSANNIDLKDQSNADVSYSTENETCEKVNGSCMSSTLEDSAMEDEAKASSSMSSKPDEKVANSTLDGSAIEDKMNVSVDDKTKKHESDAVNDSGIEPGSVINA